jgi:hypothetical protein
MVTIVTFPKNIRSSSAKLEQTLTCKKAVSVQKVNSAAQTDEAAVATVLIYKRRLGPIPDNFCVLGGDIGVM